MIVTAIGGAIVLWILFGYFGAKIACKVDGQDTMYLLHFVFYLIVGPITFICACAYYLDKVGLNPKRKVKL